MLKNLTLLVLIAAFSTLAFAQESSQQEELKEPPPSNVCVYPFSSGSGYTETQYCLSVNGNIVQFSRPSDTEYLRKGGIVEGYGICDKTASLSYFDYADKNTGNWQETKGSAPNPTTRKFVRATSDGVWELTQSIVQGRASASRPGTIQVTMSLKNISGIRRDVRLARLADVNLGPGPEFDRNIFVSTPQTASAYDQAYGAGGNIGGLALTNNISSIGGRAITRSANSYQDPCSWDSFWPYVGDGLIGQWYQHSVAAGSTMKVTMTYRPI